VRSLFVVDVVTKDVKKKEMAIDRNNVKKRRKQFSREKIAGQVIAKRSKRFFIVKVESDSFLFKRWDC
jgi:hypothetical protein